VIAFALVFATARSIVGATGALVAVLIVDGLHYFQYTAVKFNHDVIQLPFWALAGYAFMPRSNAAASFTGSCSASLSAARCGPNISSSCWRRLMRCFLLFDRNARAALATPGPWVAVAVAIIIASPHVIWLFQTDFLPFAYAEHRAAPVRGWSTCPAPGGVYSEPAILRAAGILHRSGPAVAEAENPAGDRRRRLRPPHRHAPRLRTRPRHDRAHRRKRPRHVRDVGYPLWLFVGLWIVMTARATLDAARVRHIVGHWSVVFAIFALVSSPIIRCCPLSITATAPCSFLATRLAPH